MERVLALLVELELLVCYQWLAGSRYSGTRACNSASWLHGFMVLWLDIGQCGICELRFDNLTMFCMEVSAHEVFHTNLNVQGLHATYITHHHEKPRQYPLRIVKTSLVLQAADTLGCRQVQNCQAQAPTISANLLSQHIHPWMN